MSERYDEYLQSAYWQDKKSAALGRAGSCCEFCGAPGEFDKLHVHHLTYERVGKERPEDLAVLCASCHQDVHESKIGPEIDTFLRRRRGIAA